MSKFIGRTVRELESNITALELVGNKKEVELAYKALIALDLSNTKLKINRTPIRSKWMRDSFLGE